MAASSRIPITISPFFWVTAAIIGWFQSGSFLGTVIWIGIIFVSVLFHEFGHAFSSRAFGQSPRIQLIAFGGLTYPEGPRISRPKEFVVVLAGPIFGFILFLVASFLLQTSMAATPTLFYILKSTQLINLFWTAVNLLPVMPLDGGQLLRIILESIFGAKGLKYTLFLSFLISLCIGAGFIFAQFFLPGVFFFLFAFQNFDTFRRTRTMTDSDQRGDLKDEIEEVEKLMQMGNIDEAVIHLEHIRSTATGGMIFSMATQLLAQLKYQEKDFTQTYELLKQAQKDLSIESKIMLHHAAFEMKDFPLVTSLAGSCFKTLPSKDIAVRTAIASAHQNDVKATVGWLKSALQNGLDNLNEVLSDSAFDEVKKDSHFTSFLEQ